MSRLERLLVAAVALHSAAVGAVLLFLPAFAVDLGGFDAAPSFFTRQGGAFHFVAAFAYLVEHRTTGGIRILVFTKTWATVFLGGVWLAGETAWAVPFSAAADAAMGAAVFAVHRAARAPTPAPAPPAPRTLR